MDCFLYDRDLRHERVNVNDIERETIEAVPLFYE